MDSSLCPWHAEHTNRLTVIEGRIDKHCNGEHISRREYETDWADYLKDRDAMTESVRELVKEVKKLDTCLSEHQHTHDVSSAGETRNLKVLMAVLVAASALLQGALQLYLR